MYKFTATDSFGTKAPIHLNFFGQKSRHLLIPETPVKFVDILRTHPQYVLDDPKVFCIELTSDLAFIHFSAAKNDYIIISRSEWKVLVGVTVEVDYTELEAKLKVKELLKI